MIYENKKRDGEEAEEEKSETSKALKKILKRKNKTKARKVIEKAAEYIENVVREKEIVDGSVATQNCAVVRNRTAGVDGVPQMKCLGNEPSQHMGKFIFKKIIEIGPDLFQLLRRGYGENKNLMLFRYPASLVGTQWNNNDRTRLMKYMARLPCSKRVPWCYLTFNPNASIEGISIIALLLCDEEYEMTDVSDEELASDLEETAAYKIIKASDENAQKLIQELEENNTRSRITIRKETEDSIFVSLTSLDAVSKKKGILTLFRRYFLVVRYLSVMSRFERWFIFDKKAKIPGNELVLKWLQGDSNDNQE